MESPRRGSRGSALEVGQALQEIHDAQLYRETHGTFEDYCRDKRGMERRYAYRMMDAAEAFGNVAHGPHSGPTSERQTRPLTALRDEDGRMDADLQRAAWSEVLEIAGLSKRSEFDDDPVTARLLERLAT
jgi:hypothetical protein